VEAAAVEAAAVEAAAVEAAAVEAAAVEAAAVEAAAVEAAAVEAAAVEAAAVEAAAGAAKNGATAGRPEVENGEVAATGGVLCRRSISTDLDTASCSAFQWKGRQGGGGMRGVQHPKQGRWLVRKDTLECQAAHLNA
jgi:nucleoid-associated protein YgaU